MAEAIDRAGARSRRRVRRQAWLFAEYMALFVGLPVAYVSHLIPLPPLPALWVLTGACLAILLGTKDFDRRKLWNARKLRLRLLRALLPFLFA
ncbi:MAG: hypothetical protein R3344_05700, partial [Acidobacteriota bacterium]|nr:hypothetical protein [Acidobacteriota bacterium]